MDLEQNGDRLAETVAASQANGATAAVPPQFIQDLFGRVPAEDLAPYAPGDLADIAAAAYAHLSAPRTVGAPVISPDRSRGRAWRASPRYHGA